jgi:hypothetical protein
VLQASYKTPGWAVGITIVGNKLYVADSYMGLRILDVTTAEGIRETGSFDLFTNHFGKIAVADGIAIAADRAHGLVVIDVREDASPKLINAISSMDFAMDVAVSGKYAYVVSCHGGMKVVDASDKSNPKIISEYDTKGIAKEVVISGQYAYISVGFGGDGSGLQIVDISDPYLPRKVGFYGIHESVDYMMDGAAQGLAVYNNYAFVGNEIGFHIIDISTPSNPKLVTMASGDAFKVEYVDNKIFSIAQNFAITDVSDLQNPKLVSSIRPRGSSYMVMCIYEHYALIGAYRGIIVYDISNPQAPEIVTNYNINGDCSSLKISGTRLYATCADTGVTILDISDIMNPKEIGNLNTLGSAMSLDVSEGYAYVAGGNAGLQILNTETTVKSGQNKPQISLTQSFNTSYLNGLIENNEQEGTNPAEYIPIAGTKSSHLVTNTNDSGPGSLRECMNQAKRGDSILFDKTVFPFNKAQRIYLNSALPCLSEGDIHIDASNAGVILD